MTVNRTTLLDLPLPVTGTESGTWGDTTNNGLSQYMDIAIAGMNSLTSANFTAGALTLANTLGDSSATNIAAGSAQYATIRVSSLAVNSTITAPGSNRSYRIINADATYSLTIKASGQTGVTFLPGQTGVVAFNGTDYVIVGVVGAGTATDNAVARFDGTTGEIIQNSGVTIDDSNNVSGIAQLNITTLDTTNIEVTNIKAKDGTAAGSIADSTGVISITSNPVLSGGTANGVLYLNGSKVATSGSALTFDGTNFGVGTSNFEMYDTNAGSNVSTFYRLKYTGGNGQTNVGTAFSNDSSGSALGFWRNNSAAKPVRGAAISADWASITAGSESASLIFSTQSGGSAASEQMRLTSTGLGIGTSSPSVKLQVSGSTAAGAISTRVTNTDATGMSTVEFSDGTNTKGQIWAGNGSYASFGGAGSLNYSANSGPHVWYTNYITGGERMRLDSSGNLGLGVTPSAWRSLEKALQIGSGALHSYQSAGINVSSNAFTNSSNQDIYVVNGYANRYLQAVGTGEHYWYTAPSGTAGNAITFTQAMTLDASGNLAVGTTSTESGVRLWVGNSAAQFNWTKVSNSLNSLYAGVRDTGEAAVSSSNAYPLLFYTNGTERARITSGGLVQVSSGGSVQIGDTAARATTAGTNRLDIFNGTAPVGTLSNGISIYSSSGEAYVMDAAGNATLFSPHDAETNEWIFKSKHTPTGKTLKIDVEKLLRFINDHFGLDAVHEFIEP